jgi:hypothetical protein
VHLGNVRGSPVKSAENRLVRRSTGAQLVRTEPPAQDRRRLPAMKWLNDLWARVRGRQQSEPPEPPEPPQRTPDEDAHELRLEAIQEKERKDRDDDDKGRYERV